jgi:hypothetical protein
MDGGVADTLSVVTRLYRYGRRCGRHNLLLHAPFGAAELFNTTRGHFWHLTFGNYFWSIRGIVSSYWAKAGRRHKHIQSQSSGKVSYDFV